MFSSRTASTMAASTPGGCSSACLRTSANIEVKQRAAGYADPLRRPGEGRLSPRGACRSRTKPVRRPRFARRGADFRATAIFSSFVGHVWLLARSRASRLPAGAESARAARAHGTATATAEPHPMDGRRPRGGGLGARSTALAYREPGRRGQVHDQHVSPRGTTMTVAARADRRGRQRDHRRSLGQKREWAPPARCPGWGRTRSPKGHASTVLLLCPWLYGHVGTLLASLSLSVVAVRMRETCPNGDPCGRSRLRPPRPALSPPALGAPSLHPPGPGAADLPSSAAVLTRAEHASPRRPCSPAPMTISMTVMARRLLPLDRLIPASPRPLALWYVRPSRTRNCSAPSRMPMMASQRTVGLRQCSAIPARGSGRGAVDHVAARSFPAIHPRYSWPHPARRASCQISRWSSRHAGEL